MTTRCGPWLAIALLIPLVSGCRPDDSPLKAENETLQKQVQRQESVIESLQEGNKVMQQQIDLLNQELRAAKEQVERVMSERTTLTAQLDAQEGKSRKLAAEVQRVAERAALLSQVLQTDEKDATLEELPYAFIVVVKAVEGALAKNGYAVRVGVKTDQRAAYVTDRKVSEPASLEVPGFRNQYLVSLQALPGNRTRVAVKAEFERMAQGRRVLPAGPEEASEIEHRLITEIGKRLPAGKA